MKQQGFSLVELIITLVILGTLAVTVVPKLLTNQSFDSFQYRDRALTALRTIQLSAMHNTDDLVSFKLCVSNTQIAPPIAVDCDNLDMQQAHLSLVIPLNETDTRITAVDSNNANFTELIFDDFGKTNLNCVNTCRIDFGEADICISDQGGIYACQ